VTFGKPDSSVSSPPEFMQHLISSRLQAVAQVSRVIAAWPISLQRLGVEFTVSRMARFCPGVVPSPIDSEEDRPRFERSGSCEACNS